MEAQLNIAKENHSPFNSHDYTHSVIALSEEELEDHLCCLAAQINAATWRWLILLREIDRRETWAAQGFRSCASWLGWRCGIAESTARDQLRVATRLAELPRISQAFAEGRLSYSKVRAMLRAATPESEDYLLLIAEHGTAAHLENMVRGYRRVVRYEAESSEAHDRYLERSLSWTLDDDGALEIRIRLAPEQGQGFIQAIEAAADEVRNERKNVSAETSGQVGTDCSLPFDRPHPRAVQRAEGLLRMTERYFERGDTGSAASPEAVTAERPTGGNGGDRRQVVIHVDEAVLKNPASPGRCELEQGPAIAAESARRACCDATLVRAVTDDAGRLLSVGRKTRAIPPAIRRAIQLRDPTCRFPGCSSRHGLDAHHIHHWADGGETRIDNLVHLCRHHHRLIHEGGFRVLRNAMGELRFFTPQGNRIGDYTALSSAETSVESTNHLAGIHPDPQTVASRWDGLPMDSGLAVEGLLQTTALPLSGGKSPECLR